MAVNLIDPKIIDPNVAGGKGGLVDNPNYRPAAGLTTEQQMALNDAAVARAAGKVIRYPINGATGLPDNTVPVTSPLEAARAQLYGSEADRAALTETGKADIRAKVRGQFDDALAAVDAYSNTLLAGARQRATGRLGQDRALQNIRGTIGSSFGAQQTAGVETVNADEEAAIEADRNLRKQAIFEKVDQRAIDETKAEVERRKGNAEAYVNALAANQTESRQAVKDLATTGTAIDEIPRAQYEKLLTQSGYDPLVFQAVYNNSLAGANKREYSYQKVGNSILAFSTNPKTGKIEREQFDVAAPEGGYDDFTVTADGTPLFINKASGTAVIAPGFKEGQFNKPTEAPASYREWQLAGGEKGTGKKYGEFIMKGEGGKFDPSKDEISAVQRFAATQGFDEESKKKLESDSGFFYSVLQKAVEGSEGGMKFPLQPFKQPFFAP